MGLEHRQHRFSETVEKAPVTGIMRIVLVQIVLRLFLGSGQMEWHSDKYQLAGAALIVRTTRIAVIVQQAAAIA